MSRTYAKIYVSIWAGDFRDLTIGAQGLYFRLLTDPKLSMCGVVDWRPKRLLQSFAGMKHAEFTRLTSELEEAGYIVVDDDTEEVLIRSFVRHDGVLKSPNLTKAMASDWLAVASRAIKESVVIEVARALEEEPDSKGSRSVPDWFRSNGSEPIGKGSGKGSRSVPDWFRSNGSEPIGKGSGKGSDSVPEEFPYPATSNLQPATINQQPSKRASAAADDAEFETWWKAYPRKTAKGNAKAPYKTARKKTDAETLLAAAATYAKSVAGKDPKFTAHASTWLNGERWLDEAPTTVLTAAEDEWTVPAEPPAWLYEEE